MNAKMLVRRVTCRLRGHDSRQVIALDDDPLGIEVRGREIRLDIGPEVDGCGQFRLSVSVDGKERWAAFFTDRSEEDEE